MDSVRAAGSIADEMTLFEFGKFFAGDNPRPDLAFNGLQNLFGRGVCDALSLVDDGNRSGGRFYVRDNMGERMTMRSPDKSASRLRKRTLSSGSSPAVGSSTISSCGSFNKACAMPTRCFIPPE